MPLRGDVPSMLIHRREQTVVCVKGRKAVWKKETGLLGSREGVGASQSPDWGGVCNTASGGGKCAVCVEVLERGREESRAERAAEGWRRRLKGD